MTLTTVAPPADSASATDPLVRETYLEIEQELGFGMVPNIFQSMASNPALLAANWQKFRATILQGRLPRGIKEMLGVVVSNVNNSPYAQAVHLHSLSVQGVQTLWLQQLVDEDQGGEALPDALRPMVAFARQAARDPQCRNVHSAAPLYEAGLDDAEVREVIATVDLFESVNAYTDLAGVQIDNI